MMRILALLLSVTAVLSLPASADDSGQSAKRLDVQVRVEMGYLLYLPKDYETKESWPLVLFLHGSGERGDDLELVKKHGPPKLISEGKQFPFIVVSPQCPKDATWEPLKLTALLDEVVRNQKVDEDQICVTGLSMGGFGTWELAAYSPKRFAAISPICGGGEPRWAKRFAHLPTWAFHGAKDEGVPLKLSQEMIDAMTKNGGTPKLTIYPDAEHDSWTETYNNPEFYEWLLAQKRMPTAAATEAK
ncbi:MAG TPA: alpha/beta hydrolase-fold protein [Planctomycetaceae bacterium]|nr:alpha/beta hydrolase-fold protein [Planctomycetaceae bacterium]